MIDFTDKRWNAVGKHAHALVFDENCEKCREGMDCACIEDIPPSAVYEILKPLADRSVLVHLLRREESTAPGFDRVVSTL